MFKKYLLALNMMFTVFLVYGANKYWMGPVNGKWNDRTNWSEIPEGAGGATLPAPDDDVYFSNPVAVNTLIEINESPVIHSFSLTQGQHVTLYSSGNITLTLLGTLSLVSESTLKDSTNADVSFNVVFSGATNATGDIRGNWIFEGGVPVSSGGHAGAAFTAEPGSLVQVFGKGASAEGGKLIFKNYTSAIGSDPSSLIFLHGSWYVLDDNLDATIPAAFWDLDSTANWLGETIVAERAPTIRISGNMLKLKHLGQPETVGAVYRYVEVDLAGLLQDASLEIPDGFAFQSLNISSTNSHNLTLLATSCECPEVTARGDSLNINGKETKIALATGNKVVPNMNYRLNITDFIQSGGNFSLQDYDSPSGNSILGVRGNLIQTGGTFLTKSTGTNARAQFVLEMNGPSYTTQPYGLTSFRNNISMSSGTIDNERHTVTLRMAQNIYRWFYFGDRFSPLGSFLQSPLSVGRLELMQGSLNTTAANVITVNNADPVTAVVTGGNGNSYINGPLRRVSHSTDPIVFPVGHHSLKPENMPDNDYTPHYHFDSCVVVPSGSETSIYEAFYSGTAIAGANKFDPSLTGIYTKGYWDVSKISGADATIRLTLHEPVPGATDADAIVVAHFENGIWVSAQGTVLTPGNLPSGNIVSKPLSAFSPFTFGITQGTISTLPVHFTAFSGSQTGSGVQLNWKVAENAAQFHILKTTLYGPANQVGTVSGIEGRRSYTFTDPLVSATAQYQIRAVDKQGNKALSDIISIANITGNRETLKIMPSPVRDNATIRWNASKKGTLKMIITDMNGRTNRQFEWMVNGGLSEKAVNLGSLPTGSYQLTAYLNGEKIHMIRFIKQ